MLETRLTELAAADAPDTNDIVFTHAVMTRIARARARRRLAVEGTVMAGLTLALAAATPFISQIAPLLGHIAQEAQPMRGWIGLTALLLAVGLGPAWLIMRR